MKSMAWLVRSLSTLAFAGTAQAHRRGDRIDRRFDRIGIRLQAWHDGHR